MSKETVTRQRSWQGTELTTSVESGAGDEGGTEITTRRLDSLKGHEMKLTPVGPAVASMSTEWIGVVEETALDEALLTTDAGRALAPYLGVCPTCLGWHAEGDDLEALDDVCPTCGQASVEWSLSCQIDDVLRKLNGMQALEQAVEQL